MDVGPEEKLLRRVERYIVVETLSEFLKLRDTVEDKKAI